MLQWISLTTFVIIQFMSFCEKTIKVSNSLTYDRPTAKKLVWSDEFNNGTRPDTAKWAYNVGTGANGWGNNESQYYTANAANARIENGHLVIEARKENKGSKMYTSARMHTQGKASWTYGRFEIRAKLPKALGTWPAIWMLGENFGKVAWPECGEIDIMEEVGKEAGVINWSAHSKKLNWILGTQKTFKLYIPGVTDDYHLYTLDWTKDFLKFYVDGTLYYTVMNEGKGKDYYPFVTPQFLLLNLAIGGNMGGNKIDDKIFPVSMIVDYVRIYQ